MAIIQSISGYKEAIWPATAVSTKNNLSSLIDEALAGEEVVITRHGKPTVALSVVETGSGMSDVGGATARLQARLNGEKLALPSQYFREWLYRDYPY